MSDLWKSYDCRQNEGSQHLTVKWPQPKLRWPRHRCPHAGHWKYMVGSKTKYASYRNIQGSIWQLPTGVVVASALQKWSIWKNNRASSRFVQRYSLNIKPLCTFRDRIQILCFWREKKEADPICLYIMRRKESWNNWKNQDRGWNKFIERSALFADAKINRPRIYKNKWGKKGVQV